jgi:hypothetical protein
MEVCNSFQQTVAPRDSAPGRPLSRELQVFEKRDKRRLVKSKTADVGKVPVALWKIQFSHRQPPGAGVTADELARNTGHNDRQGHTRMALS